jgi:hypothetical protein
MLKAEIKAGEHYAVPCAKVSPRADAPGCPRLTDWFATRRTENTHAAAALGHRPVGKVG